MSAASIRVRAVGDLERAPWTTISSQRGLYDVDHLKPGMYSLVAEFAGQALDVVNIGVVAGEATIVDLVFTLGRPEPIRVDFSKPEPPLIRHYRPKDLAANISRIEGTLTATTTKERVSGAVITLIGEASTDQMATDEMGRFLFPTVIPGAYTVSASYSVAGRAQIEVRRSGIEVRGGESADVPLWIEIAK